MKAVMWTDSFQICMMFAGLFAVIIQGAIIHGGFANIWEINNRGGRIIFDEWVRSDSILLESINIGSIVAQPVWRNATA